MGTISAICVLLASLGSTPRDEVIVDHVDLVELNHYFDEQGKPVLDQLIFYDWSPTDGRFQVRAWRLLKNPAAVPQRDAATGEFLSRWHDNNVLRKVYARQFRETWTQYDPELVERDHLPKDKRRDLRKLASHRTLLPSSNPANAANPANSTATRQQVVSNRPNDSRPDNP